MTRDASEHEDAALTQQALSALPTVPVPAELAARILADFDAVAAGLARRPANRWRDALWPGVPVWKPATVLALSLMVGLAAGALLPSSAFSGDNTDQTQVSSLDSGSALDLSGDL
ncbi:MAG: hypothetical protein KGJ78_01325 [Alphaproteobacteria bacterium]|nr:hypothetical protein [Alphaproteobacteria bacterium]